MAQFGGTGQGRGSKCANLAASPLTISPVFDVGDGGGIQAKASAEANTNSGSARTRFVRFAREP